MTLKRGYFKMKKIILIVLIFMFATCGCTVEEIPEINIGDYFEFGTYNDAPILWRVINVEENGDFLLFSDKIIDLKPFDAFGEYHKDEDRRYFGSNNWENSNIRQWLNSEEKSGEIEWIQNKPSENNVLFRLLPYDMEAGFLSAENFKKNHLAIIREVTHKTLLNKLDFDQKDGGERAREHSTEIYLNINKYEESTYNMINDRVFLLSTKEAYKYLYLNRDILGDKYYIGILSDNVFDKPQPQVGFLAGNPWSYLLRTPSNSIGSNVRTVFKGGKVLSSYASLGMDGGVRPALMIDKKQLTRIKGEGSVDIPYKIK
jgi:hypothetical protein